MSDLVKVISNKEFSNQELAILNRFKEFQLALIEKDEIKLNEILDDNYELVHMSGKRQNKEEFIGEILDGVLNYYHSTIKNVGIDVKEEIASISADVTLDAKVYGIKGVWTLNTNITLRKINNVWYFFNWDN